MAQRVTHTGYDFGDGEIPYFPWVIPSEVAARWSRLLTPLLASRDHSRDVPRLCETTSHLLFVYGTLKQGGGLHHCLKDSEFVCAGRTVLKSFHMWQTDDAGVLPFPVVLLRDKDDTTSKAVHGELFRVDTPTLKRLDRIEGNGSWYQRFRFRIKCLPPFDGQEISAWMYIGKKNAWSHGASNLKRCPVYWSDNSEPFYTFEA